MLKKAKAQVAALNKNLQKGIGRLIFGLLEGHVSHQKFTEAIFRKSERLFKMHGLKLGN